MSDDCDETLLPLVRTPDLIPDHISFYFHKTIVAALVKAIKGKKWERKKARKYLRGIADNMERRL